MEPALQQTNVAPSAVAGPGSAPLVSAPTTISAPRSRVARRHRVPEDARRRSVRACLECRRLKEKCNGRQPCERCLRTGRQCEFGSVATSSSRVPTSAGDPRDDGKDERLSHLERIAAHFLGNVPLDLNNLRRITERLSSRPEASSVSGDTILDDLEGLTLEDENFTVKTLSPNIAHYSGEFSHWNFSQRIRQRLWDCLESPSATAPQGNPLSIPSNERHDVPGTMKILEYWRATQLRSPNSQVIKALNCLPPRKVADFLVQMYFQFAQVNCFIVGEAWLREKLAVLYEESGRLTIEDAPWICAVIMVLAIGTQFAHMAVGGAPQGGLASLENKNEDESPLEPDVSLTFYQLAARLIPDIMAIASLESVQACLLLASYSLPIDSHGLGYTYAGLAVKMAIQNGMHRRYTGSDLDVRTVEMRNRLWWSAYTMEKRVSVLHGRPASITSFEIDVELPKDLPEFRHYDYPSKFRNMSALIYITERLGDIANAITLLRRCPQSLQPSYFERVVSLHQKLKTWWSTLPRDMQNLSTTSPLCRSNAHLKLHFHLVEIYAGRPFVFHDSKQPSPRPTMANLQDQQSNSTRRKSRAVLVSGALNAAFEVIETLRMLYEAKGLARFSYVEFSSCRAALLIMLAGSLCELTERTSAMIDLGMRLIGIMSKGNNFSTQSETSIIEALEVAVRRLHGQRNGNSSDTTGSPASVDGEKTSYERFKKWASLWKGTGAESQSNNPLFSNLTMTPIMPDGVTWSPSAMPAADVASWTVDGFDFDMADALNLDVHDGQLDDIGIYTDQITY